MAQLLIRNIEARTMERLKERARRHRRSLQGEAKVILEVATSLTRDEAWAQAEDIRVSFGGKRFSDSAVLVREDRKR